MPSEDFWRLLTAFDDEEKAMRQAWYRNDWRAMATHADRLAEVAAQVADGARQVAEREQPVKSAGGQ